LFTAKDTKHANCPTGSRVGRAVPSAPLSPTSSRNCEKSARTARPTSTLFAFLAANSSREPSKAEHVAVAVDADDDARREAIWDF